jgi:hypothetical protein
VPRRDPGQFRVLYFGCQAGEVKFSKESFGWFESWNFHLRYFILARCACARANGGNQWIMGTALRASGVVPSKNIGDNPIDADKCHKTD